MEGLILSIQIQILALKFSQTKISTQNWSKSQFQWVVQILDTVHTNLLFFFNCTYSQTLTQRSIRPYLYYYSVHCSQGPRLELTKTRKHGQILPGPSDNFWYTRDCSLTRQCPFSISEATHSIGFIILNAWQCGWFAFCYVG